MTINLCCEIRVEVTAVFIATFLNGRYFKGIKCVRLKELSSVGLKLIGLISDPLSSYGYTVGGALIRILNWAGTCLHPFSPAPLLNNITLTVQTV